MKSSSPSEVNGKKVRKRLAIFGGSTLWISILIHLLFGVGAAYLVVEHFQKKHINFQATEPPAPHTEVEHKVEMAQKNNVESAPPDLKRITTTDLSAISLPDVPDTPQTPDTTMSAMAGDGVTGDGPGGGVGGGGGSGGGGEPVFGAASGDGLVGDFYDLKQTLDGKPTGITVEQWQHFAVKYIAAGWDDSLLEPYLKSDKPLYARSFIISPRLSVEAPKAFHLEKQVRPGLWLVHYHGKVMAPEGGDYRFMGFGDDVLEVKIDGVLVLDAGYISMSTNDNLHQQQPNIWSKTYGTAHSADHVEGRGPTNGKLKIGPTFHMDIAQPVDMDVLIGDQGGRCSFYLFVEKEGNAYQKLDDGTPILPFFRIDDDSEIKFLPNEEYPQFQSKSEPWMGTGK